MVHLLTKNTLFWLRLLSTTKEYYSFIIGYYQLINVINDRLKIFVHIIFLQY